MRAEYIKDLENYKGKQEITLDSREYSHLIKIARVEAGEEVLLLNGKGLQIVSTVKDVSKKQCILSLGASNFENRKYNIDLLLALPKKDTLEEAFDFITQLGIRRVYLWNSEYSQLKSFNEDRLQKIMISALKQSNNFYMPEYEILNSDYQKIISSSDYESVFLFTLEDENDSEFVLNSQKQYLYIIGPEGGLSSSEENQIKNAQSIVRINMPSPILKVVPAISTGLGFLLSRLKS